MKKSFSLLEIMVALTVFTFVTAGVATTFVSIDDAYQRQKKSLELVQNVQWAIEFITNELHYSTTTAVPGWSRINVQNNGNRLRFGIDADGDDTPETRVWYWRGDTASDSTGFGDSSYIYRGVGLNINQAYNSRQQLVNLIAPNPTGNDIFTLNGNVLNVELTVRPIPTQAIGKGNRDYTLRSEIKTRN